MSCAWLDGARHPDGRQAAARFGKRVHISRNDTMCLAHCNGPREPQAIGNGLRTTKFGKGFQRRPHGAIRPDVERCAWEAAKLAKRDAHHQRRKDHLAETAAYNGFDFVSGSYDARKVRGQRKQARYLSDRPSDELLRSGEITIRNSHYRFYSPIPSGPDHDRRQHHLVTEGLLKPKYTSVLGIGRSEARSDGVEDQFSRAEYQPELRDHMTSLVNELQPGKYTPRKMGTHVPEREHIFAGTWRREQKPRPTNFTT